MAAIALPDDLTALHDREWERLRRPGTWLDGEQRVAVADGARGGATPGPAEVAAQKIYDEPATITSPPTLSG